MKTLLPLLLLLAGCVTSRPVSLPSGVQGFAISCPGTARDISDCMNRAAEVCGGAYEVVDRSSESTGGLMTAYGNQMVMQGGIHRTLVVQCK